MAGPIAPQVVLPWAVQVLADAALQRVADADLAADAVAESTPDSHDSFAAAGSVTRPTHGASRLAPGLPYRPLPLPLGAEHALADTSAVLGAAVVLDVVATRTRAVGSAPTMLASLCDTLAPLLALDDGEGEERTSELLAFADSPAGASRSELAARMHAALGHAPGLPAPLPYTPAVAAEALRRIEELAALLVSDARALLESAETADFRRA